MMFNISPAASEFSAVTASAFSPIILSSKAKKVGIGKAMASAPVSADDCSITVLMQPTDIVELTSGFMLTPLIVTFDWSCTSKAEITAFSKCVGTILISEEVSFAAAPMGDLSVEEGCELERKFLHLASPFAKPGERVSNQHAVYDDELFDVLLRDYLNL